MAANPLRIFLVGLLASSDAEEVVDPISGFTERHGISLSINSSAATKLSLSREVPVISLSLAIFLQRQTRNLLSRCFSQLVATWLPCVTWLSKKKKKKEVTRGRRDNIALMK